MAVKNLNMPVFPPFDLDDYTTVGTRWTKYKKRFANLCVALHVTDDKQKLALLLNYVGEEAYDIYDSTLVPGADENLANAIKLFDDYFNPKTNTSYEIYVFRNMRQQVDESVQQYFIRLKLQAQKCDFNATLDTELKRQVELSTTNNKLRRYSFQNPALSLTDFLKYAKTLEDSNTQADVVEKWAEEKEVNRIAKGYPGNKQFSGKKSFSVQYSQQPVNNNTHQKSCFRCGGIYPHVNSCPAYNKKCNNCSKMGHFASCCRTKTGIPSFPSPYRQNSSPNHRPLNAVNVNTHENSDSECDPVFALNSSSSNNNMEQFSRGCYDNNLECTSEMYAYVNSIEKFNVTVSVEKQPIRLLIDSGAGINVMNINTFNSINRKLKDNNKISLRKTKTKLLTYGESTPSLRSLGVATVLLETKQKFLTTEFHVVNTQHRNLLSGASALKLNLISLPVNNVTASDRAEQSSLRTGQRIEPLIDKYKESLFSGKIGKLRDYKVKLHINENVAPVAQRERRIPFALREKVQKEIEQLEKLGIIEDVTGKPTPWLSQLVVVPKGEKGIRLCIDMRNANTAITCTRYPTPTVDDLLVKLRGSIRFTKLDLNSAFYQLELEENSRFITAFQTEDRIKRFKRLIFGASSASEELQHALRNILIDLPGVVNIADDLLVFGDSIEKHDEHLTKVLDRLEEKGITLNFSKCIFDKENVEFYGFIFNSEGMKPSPRKIEALKNIKQPVDQKSVRSFLGLAN